MFNRWFKRVFLLCFIISCQTTEITNIRSFKGFFSVEGKQSHSVEIYADTSKPVLQINILNPFGSIFAVYLWKNQEHQIILPSRKQYFKQKKWPARLPFQGLIQEPQTLYQALLQQWSQAWSCQKVNKKLQKCHKNDFVIEWEKKFFQKDQIRISLKKEGFLSKLKPHKSPSRTSLDIEIPKGFRKIKETDFLQ